MTPEIIQEMIQNHLGGHTVATVMSDDHVHFQALVISDQFEGITSRVKRQQLVYQALQSHLSNNSIHAIRLKTLTPAESQKHQS